jgi:hypothetical protein
MGLAQAASERVISGATRRREEQEAGFGEGDGATGADDATDARALHLEISSLTPPPAPGEAGRRETLLHQEGRYAGAMNEVTQKGQQEADMS